MQEELLNDEFGEGMSCQKLLLLIGTYSLISLDIIICALIFCLELYLED